MPRFPSLPQTHDSNAQFHAKNAANAVCERASAGECQPPKKRSDYIAGTASRPLKFGINLDGGTLFYAPLRGSKQLCGGRKILRKAPGYPADSSVQSAYTLPFRRLPGSPFCVRAAIRRNDCKCKRCGLGIFMLKFASFALLSCALAVAPVSSTALSYPTAVKDAQAKQQPLLVLVGAQWCPGCQTMKQSVLPALARSGGLERVSYATIDTDREPQVAGRLMRGGAIPQLIVFSRQPDGAWHREQITGAASEREVQSLIARAWDAQGAKPAASAGTAASGSAIGE
jgi:thiol-disulfide isomerase/thioredoxin